MDLWCTSSQVIAQWNTSIGHNQICNCDSLFMRDPPDNFCFLQTAVDCIEVIFIRGRSVMYFKVFLADGIPTGTIIVTIGQGSSQTYFLFPGLKVKWLKVENQIQFDYAQGVVFLHSGLAVFGTYWLCWWFIVTILENIVGFISDGDCIVLTLTRLQGKTTVFKVFDGGILTITLG